MTKNVFWVNYPMFRQQPQSHSVYT